MADRTTFIKIDRNIVNWKWWTDHNTLILFLYLLLAANVKDNGFAGKVIHRGQLATSLNSLCDSTGLTCMQVRTAIKHLESTGEITNESFTKYRIITITNYEKYQGVTNKITDKQQTSNKQVTNKQQQSKNVYKYTRMEEGKKGGRSAPQSPSGGKKNGLPKDRDEGTVDDIPEMYKEQFKDYASYWDWRNQ